MISYLDTCIGEVRYFARYLHFAQSSLCVRQVTNHLDVPVEVYYMTERGNEVEAVVSLGPKESALLPLHAAYSPTAELFFCVEG